MTRPIFRPPAPPGERHEISSLLIHLAGEFAPAIAAVWPSPHAGFLTAPAARRQLVALALANGSAASAVAPLLEIAMRQALRLAIADPPGGLHRALGRMGESCWSAADYGRLLWALRHPQAAKAIRHAEQVTPELVRMLGALPEPMILAASRHEIGPAGAELLHECYAAIAVARGEAAAAELAGRWAGMSLTKLRASLLGEFAAELPSPPFPGTARLRPLGSLDEVREAGRRYRNCLGGDLSYLADGEYAYYEWLGPPAVLVELYRDRVIGWRFEQARLARNEPVPPRVGGDIEAELASMGVGLGRAYWQLRQAVSKLGTREFALEPLEQVAAERFGRA